MHPLKLVLILAFLPTLLWADVVVYTEVSPPHQIVDDQGNVTGDTVDKVRAILKAADIQASFEVFPWARTLRKAQENSNSLIFSIAKTPEREALFHWLAPVSKYELSFVALSNRDDIKLTKPLDSMNYKVSVQRNDVAHLWLKRQGYKEGKDFIVCPDILCSWQLLLKGSVDLIIEDPALIPYVLTELEQPIDSAHYIIMIPELEVIGYLAANKDLPEKLLQKLRAVAD